jgi:hypothetical protein
MRFPVFARRSHPSTHSPIQRKSKSYVEEEVLRGRADWIDPNDHRKGIICREMLYFGEKRVVVDTVSITSFSGELPGLKYVAAPMAKNPTIARLISELLPQAAPRWDWSQEPDVQPSQSRTVCA